MAETPPGPLRGLTRAAQVCWDRPDKEPGLLDHHSAVGVGPGGQPSILWAPQDTAQCSSMCLSSGPDTKGACSKVAPTRLFAGYPEARRSAPLDLSLGVTFRVCTRPLRAS